MLNTPFDKEITDLMEEELTSQGVHLYLNSAVTEITENNEVKAIVNGSKFIPVDIVVIAIGVRPNTAFLKDTGIEMLPNGAIIIDEYGRTTVRDLYSAGDCATVPHQLLKKPAYIPLATSANKLGRLVGENMSGAMTAYQKTLGTICIKVLDLEAGATGLTEEQAKKLGINYGTAFVNDMNQAGYYPGQESPKERNWVFLS
ncbi:FAD-dependent oxidoreductase [Lachnoclostridium phytofermentans]|nr:FAD-dependent oxidoreductase [Lachnoclostridium phytofermentans]